MALRSKQWAPTCYYLRKYPGRLQRLFRTSPARNMRFTVIVTTDFYPESTSESLDLDFSRVTISSLTPRPPTNQQGRRMVGMIIPTSSVAKAETARMAEFARVLREVTVPPRSTGLTPNKEPNDQSIYCSSIWQACRPLLCLSRSLCHIRVS
jgi:hypothetical protein